MIFFKYPSMETALKHVVKDEKDYTLVRHDRKKRIKDFCVFCGEL